LSEFPLLDKFLGKGGINENLQHGKALPGYREFAISIKRFHSIRNLAMRSEEKYTVRDRPTSSESIVNFGEKVKV
jgi:hypothetical protein